jgi:glutamine cyclotransferase
MKKYLAVLIGLLVFACNNTEPSEQADSSNTAIAAPTALNYLIQKVYPHDTSAYTQGLEWYNNRLVEGTGLRGKSILYQMDEQLKPFGKKVNLELPYFGEGRACRFCL